MSSEPTPQAVVCQLMRKSNTHFLVSYNSAHCHQPISVHLLTRCVMLTRVSISNPSFTHFSFSTLDLYCLITLNGRRLMKALSLSPVTNRSRHHSDTAVTQNCGCACVGPEKLTALVQHDCGECCMLYVIIVSLLLYS